MKRRRFLTITAAAGAAAILPTRRADAMTRWRGVAMGAAASILVEHPQADRLIALALAEIDRLEAIFSLYRPASEISRLNADGRLPAPSFELLECLSLAGRVHRTTGGMFDPTIQPLWALYAEHAAAGLAGLPPADARRAALAVTGWNRVAFGPSAVDLPPGGALTLNGIAQGYVADRVARVFRAQGLSDVLIDTGEISALGRNPRGGPWRVSRRGADLSVGPGHALTDMAMATSAPLGTVFDRAGTVGHILDPRSGVPAGTNRASVSVIAPSAAVADALSTAFCGLSDAAIAATLGRWPGAYLADADPA